MNIRKYSYYLKSIFELLLGFKHPWLILQIFLSKKENGLFVVELKKPSLRFTVRGTMDIWAIKETFLDKFYEQYSCPIKDNWTIIDIGAGIGDYSIFAAHQHPANHVFAYEPFPPSYDLLNKNLSLNQINNVHPFPLGISDRTGKIRLDLSGGEPLQITSNNNSNPNQESQHALIVDSISLAEALSTNNISCCDLLKLDCEGAEFPILLNTDKSTLRKIKRIIMEYHDHVTDFSHENLVDFLQKNDYQVKTFPNRVHSNIGYLYAERLAE